MLRVAAATIYSRNAQRKSHSVLIQVALVTAKIIAQRITKGVIARLTIVHLMIKSSFVVIVGAHKVTENAKEYVPHHHFQLHSFQRVSYESNAFLEPA